MSSVPDTTTAFATAPAVSFVEREDANTGDTSASDSFLDVVYALGRLEELRMRNFCSHSPGTKLGRLFARAVVINGINVDTLLVKVEVGVLD
jgi:hypothetical protein